MRRRLALVLLLLSVFWQAFAIAGQATAFADAEEVAHAALHWQEESHHHHDDGSVALDDSDESLQHVVADGCLSTLLVWQITSFSFAPLASARPLIADETASPSPHLAGRRRPPRLTA
ncbi:hypothetical protein D3C86_1304840 [compost metagenome]|uniref:hypothetical protein n=1 Tax=Variovorax boronicumulans TaxID=436515 RepID=UPI000BB35D73|nr:hypothetical protein [Variovorax boronicumulans]